MGNWFALNAPRPPAAAPGAAPAAGPDWFAQNAPGPTAPPSPPASNDGWLARAYAMAKDAGNSIVSTLSGLGGYAQTHPAADTAQQMSVGGVKGAAHTGWTFGELANRVARSLPNAPSDSVLGNMQRQRMPAEPHLLQPSNPAQAAGYGGEQMVEYALPGGEAEKGVTLARDAIDASKLGNASGLLARAAKAAAKTGAESAIRGATDAGVATLQGGNPVAAGVTGAAMPLVTGAAKTPFKMLGGMNRAARSAIVGDLDAPMEGTPITPRQIAAHAAAENIPATAAQLTGAPTLETVQKTGQNNLPGAAIVRRANTAAEGGLQLAWNRFLGRLAPEGGAQRLTNSLYVPQTAADAGKTTQDLLNFGLDRERLAVGKMFRNLDDVAGGARVTPANTAAKIAELDQRFANRKKGLPSLLPKQTLGIVDDLRQWPGIADPVASPKPDIWEREFGGGAIPKPSEIDVPWSRAQDARSALLTAGHLPGDPIEGEGRAAIRELAKALDMDAEGSAAGLPQDAIPLWRDANARHAGLAGAYGNPRSKLFQATQALDRSTVNPMLADGSTDTLDALRRYIGDGFEMDPFRADFVRRLGTADNGAWEEKLFQRNLAGYSPEYLQALFRPEDLEALQAANRRSIAATLLDKNEKGMPDWAKLQGNIRPAQLQAAGFSPEDIQWLRTHAALAANVAKNINPSGTARSTQGFFELGSLASGLGSSVPLAALGHPVAAASTLLGGAAPMAAGYGAARLSVSPALTRWALGPDGRLAAAAAAAKLPYGKLSRAVEAAAARRASGGDQ